MAIMPRNLLSNKGIKSWICNLLNMDNDIPLFDVEKCRILNFVALHSNADRWLGYWETRFGM